MAALRIPFADVMRILASVLLLGNIEFTETAERRLCLRTEEGWLLAIVEIAKSLPGDLS